MRSWIGIATLGLLCAMWSSTAMADDAYRRTGDIAPESQDLTTQAPPPQPVDYSFRANRIEVFGEGGYGFNGTVKRTEPWVADEFDLPQGFVANTDLGRNLVGGGGFGFNVGTFLNVAFDFTAGPVRLSNYGTTSAGQIYPGTQSHNDGVLMREMCDVEFYPIPGPLTPLIGGGIGAMTTYSHDQRVDETDFAYSAAGGVRWDINRDLFFKAVYHEDWFRVHHADKTTDLGTVLITLGWKF